MLHILLLILKIIGMIIVGILGILVLLIGIILFVPVRYEGKAVCEKTMKNLRILFLFEGGYDEKEVSDNWTACFNGMFHYL